MGIRETVFDTVCEQRDLLPLFMAVVSVMGVLLAFSLLSLSPGSAAYAIALVDAVLVVGLLVLFGGTYWYCTAQAMDE